MPMHYMISLVNVPSPFDYTIILKQLTIRLPYRSDDPKHSSAQKGSDPNAFTSNLGHYLFGATNLSATYHQKCLKMLKNLSKFHSFTIFKSDFYDYDMTRARWIKMLEGDINGKNQISSW